MEILFLLLVFIVLILLLVKSNRFRFPIRFFHTEKQQGFLQYSPIPDDIELDEVLQVHFAFYHLLSVPDKLKFRMKLIELLKSKWFKGLDGLELNNEMMLLIAATMAQVSFGLPSFTFPKFNRIVIFPKRFYSEIIKHDLKGLTIFKTGEVFISWSDYEKGYSEPTDKLNLGLHEMGHALFLDYFHSPKNQSTYFKWFHVANPIMESMKSEEQPQFLREYAKSNIHEFWAVCVEHFFEVPIQFKEQLPKLYNAMCIVLKQDMAQRIFDYSESQKQKI